MKQARRLGELTSEQWRSGVAAWLGWTFDGLDMHLYTLVYAPFVAELIGATSTLDTSVGRYASVIQGGFLLGWAIGGAAFGALGDVLGRSRTLALTVLTYALFTGLSCLAQSWWHLLVFRFVAALGIGGEWALGASLLTETWPSRWRPWLAALLQTGVNVGILMAVASNVALSSIVAERPRWIFVVGVLPAFLVFWIRRNVPEPAEWHAARRADQRHAARFGDLFRGSVRRTTVITTAVCAISLTAHWAFMFWHQLAFKNLPDVVSQSAAAKHAWGTRLLFVIIVASTVGNFVAAALARGIGYRRAIAVMCFGYFLSLSWAYAVPRAHLELFWWLALPGVFQGLFALFTMYLPPLFPTLLRTTGAGFCYNIGRVVSAAGVIFFGLFQRLGDYRLSLLGAAFLFLPAALLALLLPELREVPELNERRAPRAEPQP